MRTTTLEDIASAKALSAEWDALAVACARPLNAPGWCLPWWEHTARRSALRVFAVFDGSDLIGLAPLQCARWGMLLHSYTSLASSVSDTSEPLAMPGREEEVAEALAAALSRATPRIDVLRFQRAPSGSPWPEQLAEGWPSAHEPRLEPLEQPMPGPFVEFGSDGYEGWLERRSSKFRSDARRRRRRLEEAGGSFRWVDSIDDAERAVAQLIAFHRVRWERRGGSELCKPGVEQALVAAARELLPSNRMRIQLIEVEGQIISVNVVLAAGRNAAGWGAGFDERWGKHAPALLSKLSVIEDCGARGARRVALGGGGESYKQRLADGEETLQTVGVLPRGRRAPLVRGVLAARARVRSHEPAPASSGPQHERRERRSSGRAPSLAR
jgi:CelD/BcsL family acetyltransferase involved in cellulose biosynthesis